MCAISTQKKRSKTLLHTSSYLLSTFFSGNREAKFQKIFQKKARKPLAPTLSSLAVIDDRLQCGFARFSLCAHLRRCLDSNCHDLAGRETLRTSNVHRHLTARSSDFLWNFG